MTRALIIAAIATAIASAASAQSRSGVAPAPSFVASGTGAIGRALSGCTGPVTGKLCDFVSVKDFGALVDGTTDDTAAYQAALNAASTVYIPPGTLLHVTVSVPASRTIICAGRNATTLKMKGSSNVNGHTIANASDVEMQNCKLDGNKANNLTNGNGVVISGTSARVYLRNVQVTNWREAGVAATAGTSYVECHGCYIDNNTVDGWQGTTVDAFGLFYSTLLSNGRYGAVCGSACTNVRELGNLYKSNAQGGSVLVGGNDSVRLGNIADTNGTGHGLQCNAMLRCVYAGNLSKSNGLSGYDFTLGSNYGSAVGNIAFSNAVRGIEIDSVSNYVSAVGNIVYRSGEAGISVYRSPSAILVGNATIENGTTTAPKYGIRLWDDLGTLPSNFARVIGNISSDDRGGSATQTHGVGVDQANTVKTLILGNRLDTNLTAGVVLAAVTNVDRVRDNTGYITQSEGNSTIASGTTAVTINHGLSVTPAAEDFTIVGTNSPTTAPGEVYVTAITATQATINVRTNPGVSGWNFRWRVSHY